MTDKRQAPDAPEKRRKRAAPTIDLTATEMSAPGSSSDAPPSNPPHETAQAAPPSDEAHAAEQETLYATRATVQQGVANYTIGVIAGFAGAIVAAIMLAALWFAGLLPALNADDQRAQITALQKQVEELQNRSAPAPDEKVIDALRTSVRKLETDFAKLSPGDKTVAERLAAADSAMKSLGIALTALNKRSDDIAAKASEAQQSAAAAEKAVGDLRDSVQRAAKEASAAGDSGQLAALQKHVASLEESMKIVREDVTKTSATDKTARLALTAASLRDLVDIGAPYQTELAQAKSLGADKKTLAPLEVFASAGLPSKAALAHELRALIPAMLKASSARTAPAGFLDRLQANASKLVRIRPVNAPPGDTPADILARIEIEAAHSDIEGVLADLASLPAPAQAPARAWIAKAKARQQALAAASRLVASTTTALGKP
jgi:hypothetical protein